ncbi:MAG: hypothetical protein LUG91_10855, partial [Ruminococcus sp.]|nr:hypothetical protein [Ruminococcus sp.]
MESQALKVQRFNNLDGLRTLAAIGIICMHIRGSIGFEISAGGGYCRLYNQPSYIRNGEVCTV